jgi:hypothetical protein
VASLALPGGSHSVTRQDSGSLGRDTADRRSVTVTHWHWHRPPAGPGAAAQAQPGWPLARAPPGRRRRLAAGPGLSGLSLEAAAAATGTGTVTAPPCRSAGPLQARHSLTDSESDSVAVADLETPEP